MVPPATAPAAHRRDRGPTAAAWPRRYEHRRTLRQLDTRARQYRHAIRRRTRGDLANEPGLSHPDVSGDEPQPGSPAVARSSRPVAVDNSSWRPTIRADVNTVALPPPASAHALLANPTEVVDNVCWSDSAECRMLRNSNNVASNPAEANKVTCSVFGGGLVTRSHQCGPKCAGATPPTGLYPLVTARAAHVSTSVVAERGPSGWQGSRISWSRSSRSETRTSASSST
jgi:hypothetical protein